MVDLAEDDWRAISTTLHHGLDSIIPARWASMRETLIVGKADGRAYGIVASNRAQNCGWWRSCITLATTQTHNSHNKHLTSPVWKGWSRLWYLEVGWSSGSCATMRSSAPRDLIPASSMDIFWDNFIFSLPYTISM